MMNNRIGCLAPVVNAIGMAALSGGCVAAMLSDDYQVRVIGLWTMAGGWIAFAAVVMLLSEKYSRPVIQQEQEPKPTTAADLYPELFKTPEMVAGAGVREQTSAATASVLGKWLVTPPIPPMVTIEQARVLAWGVTHCGYGLTWREWCVWPDNHFKRDKQLIPMVKHLYATELADKFGKTYRLNDAGRKWATRVIKIYGMPAHLPRNKTG